MRSFLVTASFLIFAGLGLNHLAVAAPPTPAFPFKPTCRQGHPITQFGSINAFYSKLLIAGEDAAIGCIALGAGGKLGRHKATETQWFYVMDGEGWVVTGSAPKRMIHAGESMLWNAGDDHESGTKLGMKVLVIEGKSLDVTALQ